MNKKEFEDRIEQTIENAATHFEERIESAVDKAEKRIEAAAENFNKSVDCVAEKKMVKIFIYFLVGAGTVFSPCHKCGRRGICRKPQANQRLYRCG